MTQDEWTSGAPDCSPVPCDLVRNGNLEFINFQISVNDYPLQAGSQGQTSDLVYCWVQSHGLPFMSTNGGSAYLESSWQKDLVMDAVGLGSSTTNGVMQYVPIEAGKLYFLKFRYQVFNVISPVRQPIAAFGPMTGFSVSFANPSAQFQPGIVAGQSLNLTVPTPIPASQQVIGQILNIIPAASVNDLQEVWYCVKANADYQILWFTPLAQGGLKSSRIRIKDIAMYTASAGGPTINAGCNAVVQLGQGCPTIPGATYLWSPATGLNNPNILNPTLNTAQISSGQQYTLTVNWNVCSQTDTVNVLITGKPILGLPPGLELCRTEFPVTLNALPQNPQVIISYQWYQWIPGQGFLLLQGATGPLLTVTGPGVYCVVASAGNNCNSFACIQVTLTPALALNTDFGMMPWAPAGSPTYYLYVIPANTQWSNVGHAYYVSEVDANYNFIAAIGVSWGNANGGGQWIFINQVLFQFERGKYYEIKHGIWNKCEWIEHRRYLYID